jgi:hypothetical protein
LPIFCPTHTPHRSHLAAAAEADPVDFKATGRRAKPLCRKAAFAEQFIPQLALRQAGAQRLANDVTNWAKSCLHCQQSKIHHHICLLPQPIPIPQQRFAHLHIDLVGPLQYSSGYSYIFMIIDRTSK